MRGFFAGIAVGAVIGVTGALWWRSSSPDPDAPSPPRAASVEVAVPASRAEPEPSAPQAHDAPQAVAPTTPPPGAAAGGGIAQAAPAAAEVGSAPSSATDPPNLSPAHARLLASQRDGDPAAGSMTALHERFAAQQRDDRWSYYAEQNLNAYLGPASAQQGFELSGVACRETLCEVQALGGTDRADQRWGTLVNGVYDQPWGREFTGIASQSHTDQGRTVILTILQRAGAQ